MGKNHKDLEVLLTVKERGWYNSSCFSRNCAGVT